MDDKAKGIGKVEIRIGNLSFSAEGEQDWLSAQLIKVLEAASPTITQAEKLQPLTGGESEGASEAGDFTVSLASFLKAKGAEITNRFNVFSPPLLGFLNAGIRLSPAV